MSIFALATGTTDAPPIVAYDIETYPSSFRAIAEKTRIYRITKIASKRSCAVSFETLLVGTQKKKKKKKKKNRPVY
jgi:hypothetical protein